MDGFTKLLKFELMHKIFSGVARETQDPRLDLVKDQTSEAYGYRMTGKNFQKERRDSDEERTYQNYCQILRTAKSYSQDAWFFRDQEVQVYGPQIFEVCNRIPQTLEEARRDLEELRNISHGMEGHGNENVKKMGRQLSELLTGLPGLTTNGSKS